MKEHRRRITCTRALALGTLYDALEQVGWTLISANSDDGILIIQEPLDGIPFVCRIQSEEARLVLLTMTLASGEYAHWDLPETSLRHLLSALDTLLHAISVTSADPDADESDHSP